MVYSPRPFKSLFAVTHTCQYWRATAIAAPELWSQLTIWNLKKNSDHITRLFINRSGDLPLDADVGRRIAVIAPHVSRLRTLVCTGEAPEDFCNIASYPAPLLEALHIFSNDARDIIYLDIFARRLILPPLFNDNFPSLRELVVDGYNPFPNNRFRNLSSLHLSLSSVDDRDRFWVPLFALLRGSPRLEELFLSLGASRNHFPAISDSIPTPATLHSLQRLHIRSFTSNLARQFLSLVDLPLDGIAMQFTNIVQGFDWMFPPTLPLELSFHSMTSLEIIYVPNHGFIIQGTNRETAIRISESSGSKAMCTEIFLHPVLWMGSQFPLRELWIHVGWQVAYEPPPLSKFTLLEKLVVRAPVGGDWLFQMLDVDSGTVPCPFLSWLDLSEMPPLGVEFMVEVLRARSKAGCKLRRLRLENAPRLVKDVGQSLVRDYVNELEFFEKGSGPCGLGLPAVCTTGLGEWWEPWSDDYAKFQYQPVFTEDDVPMINTYKSLKLYRRVKNSR